MASAAAAPTARAALVAVAATAAVASGDPSVPVHVAFCAECRADMDWKSAGLYHSWHVSGMPGRITRLLACDEEQLARYPRQALEMGPTYVHRNYRTQPRVPKDHSGSYNKAASIMHFVQDVVFAEEFVLYLDADMLIRRPLVPADLGVKKGVVVSEHVMYLEKGVQGGLVEQFVPDHAGKPAAVGWYHFFHKDDITRIAPLWLEYCERMRTEPEKYWSKYGKIPKDIPTGDAFVRPGGIPWIAEMYGYVIAAADVGVDHVLTHGVVKYAEWPQDHEDKPDWIADPHIVHNGIGCSVKEGLATPYRFEKSRIAVNPAGGCARSGPADYSPRRYAPQPPAFDLEGGKRRPFHEQLCIWATNVLNNAFCGFYRATCDGEPDVCPVEYESAGRPTTGADGDCADRNPTSCPGWASAGECSRNHKFMVEECARSCGLCVHVAPLDRRPERTFNGTLGANVILPGVPHGGGGGDAPTAGTGEGEDLGSGVSPRAAASYVEKRAAEEPVPQIVPSEPFRKREGDAGPGSRSKGAGAGADADLGFYPEPEVGDLFEADPAVSARSRRPEDVQAVHDPLRPAESSPADVEAPAERIRRQMLFLWSSIILCACGCLWARIFQVGARRRMRDRKRRDFASKHAV